MTILLPKPYEPDDRDLAINIIMDCIEHAMTGARSVSLYELAETIIDEVDDARASAEDYADWLAALPNEPEQEDGLTEAEERRLNALSRDYLAMRKAGFTKPAKPRIRVQAVMVRAA